MYELTNRKDRTALNDYLRAAWMGNFLLDQKGLTCIDDWGGVDVMKEVLPEDYKQIVEKVQVPLLDVCLKDKNRAAARAVFGAAQDYFEMVQTELDKEKPVCLHFFPMSTEILWATGVVPIAFESMGAIQAVFFKDGAETYIDRVISEGFPDHLCSAQTSTVGMLLEGLIPKPDMLLKASSPCDESNAMNMFVSHKYDIPLLVFETPYRHTERALKFVVEELKQVIERIEKITGNAIDEDKLREHIGYSNEAIDYYRRVQQLRRTVPMPDTAWHRPADTIFLTQLGSPMGAAYYKALYEDVQGRVDRGEGVVPEGKQEKRLAYGYAWVAYDLPMFDWLEEQHGAVYTSDVLSYWPHHAAAIDTGSMESMLEGLAWRSLHMPMVRQAMGFSDLWINDFVTIVKAYNVDALILAGHWSCKHFWPLNKLLSDKVKEVAGIPSLRFEIDLIDKRFTPSAEFKRIMSEFLESL